MLSGLLLLACADSWGCELLEKKGSEIVVGRWVTPCRLKVFSPHSRSCTNATPTVPPFFLELIEGNEGVLGTSWGSRKSFLSSSTEIRPASSVTSFSLFPGEKTFRLEGNGERSPSNQRIEVCAEILCKKGGPPNFHKRGDIHARGHAPAPTKKKSDSLPTASRTARFKKQSSLRVWKLLRTMKGIEDFGSDTGIHFFTFARPSLPDSPARGDLPPRPLSDRR